MHVLWSDTRREAALAGRLCTSCGSKPPRLGKRSCQRCADWHSADRKANPEKYRAWKRAWRAKSPEKHRLQQQRQDARRRVGKVARRRQANLRKFGLTLEAYERLVVTQGGRCLICGCIPPDKLVVDHCHNTQIVRGLLCNTCNIGLGMFREDQGLLVAAREYLAEAQQVQGGAAA